MMHPGHQGLSIEKTFCRTETVCAHAAQRVPTHIHRLNEEMVMDFHVASIGLQKVSLI